jgi:predicted DNA-binding transcriptional regulator YafY
MLKVTDTNQELTKVRLEKAMKSGHPVTVTYTKADGETTVRTIEIFELKQSKAGDFYVRAMDRKTGEARSFRIDRMQWITIHRTGFLVKRPTNFKEVIMAKDSGAPVEQDSTARAQAVEALRVSLGFQSTPSRVKVAVRILEREGALAGGVANESTDWAWRALRHMLGTHETASSLQDAIRYLTSRA